MLPKSATAVTATDRRQLAAVRNGDDTEKVVAGEEEDYSHLHLAFLPLSTASTGMNMEIALGNADDLK